jgi:formylglycine-generating enzyme required for sulfatase activity
MRHFLSATALTATIALLVGCGSANETGDLGATVGSSLATYQVIEIASGAITQRDSIPDLATNDAYRTTSLVFRRIEGGTYPIGAAAGEVGAQSDETQSSPTVEHYYIGVFEVTQDQWQRLSTLAGAASTPWTGVTPAGVGGGTGLTLPAYGVSQQVATQLLAQVPWHNLALPNAVQWEIAARGGSTAAFAWGAQTDESIVAPRALVAETNGGSSGPEAVGGLQPNAYGLYDMHGNVWELTGDGFIHGGSWHDTVMQARSANRVALDPTTAHALVGVRLVLNP